MKRSLTGIALALLMTAPAAEAATVVIGNGASRLILRIGTANATVNLVSIAVPGANVGDGTPVVGTSGITSAPCAANLVYISAENRATPANSRTATLTVNSATPLTTGAFTIPFTQIDWLSTAPGGGPNACFAAPVTIASGAFTGAAGQVMTSFLNSRRACVCKQFRYLNQNVVSAGTYTGRVTYTLAMP